MSYGSRIYEGIRTLNPEDDIEFLKKENKTLRRELETERSLNHQLQKVLFEGKDVEKALRVENEELRREIGRLNG